MVILLVNGTSDVLLASRMRVALRLTEQPFPVPEAVAVPRISAAHEAQVRERIIRAATAVFAEKGYHRATIADVVARSGLSVGAIYTHFRGKDELFLQSCD